MKIAALIFTLTGIYSVDELKSENNKNIFDNKFC